MPIEPKDQPPYYQRAEQGTYKVYKAKLMQTGTNAPTAHVFEDTTGLNLTWVRDAVGIFRLTGWGSELTVENIMVTWGHNTAYQGHSITIYKDPSTNQLRLLTYEDGTPQDRIGGDYYQGLYIDLRIYQS